jgi:hypothetical protein
VAHVPRADAEVADKHLQGVDEMISETSADRSSRPVLRKFKQMAEMLKPRSLSARFVALSRPQRTMVLLILCLLAIVLTTFNRYGFTTDEMKGVNRAKAALDCLKSLGKVCESSGIDASHGTAPDLLALLLQKNIPPHSLETRHLVFALFGVAGVYYIYRFGSKFVGEWVGVFAALFLATTPMWFGHMFFNAKDIPFATILLASSYYSLLALTEPTIHRGLWVKTGLAVGLLAVTKLGGLAAFVFVVATYLACLATLPNQKNIHFAPDLWRRIASLGLASVVGVLLCLLVFWPQVYVLEFEFREHGWSIFRASQDPYYAATYFIVSTPVFLLGLAAAGLGCAMYRREAPIIAAIIIFFAAFFAQALSDFRVYDGARHFLFVYPFFMLIAAYPVALMLNMLKGKLARAAVIGSIALCVASTIIEMYRLFPYQYSFYNSLVGGFAGADGVYQIDTWRAADREAVDLIASRITPGDTVRIRSCGSKLNLKTHPGLILSKSNKDADYFIAIRSAKRCTPEVFYGQPVVGEVRREGVLLARVYAARQ